MALTSITYTPLPHSLCTHTHAHTHTHTHMHRRTHTQTHTHKHIYTHTHKCIDTTTTQCKLQSAPMCLCTLVCKRASWHRKYTTSAGCRCWPRVTITSGVFALFEGEAVLALSVSERGILGFGQETNGSICMWTTLVLSKVACFWYTRIQSIRFNGWEDHCSSTRVLRMIWFAPAIGVR